MATRVRYTESDLFPVKNGRVITGVIRKDDVDEGVREYSTYIGLFKKRGDRENSYTLYPLCTCSDRGAVKRHLRLSNFR